MNKAYKFRLLPNPEQEILLNKTFGCTRFIYNKMLSERKNMYEKYKGNKERLTKQKLPTPAKYKVEFNWLKEVDSLALANAQINLQRAYNNFFKDKNFGFPKFKNKRRNRDSYTTNNQHGSIRIDGNKIKLPKLGFVKFIQHKDIRETIKSCTLSKSPTGKYYISILVQYEKQIIKTNPKTVLGLDMDMKNLYTDSQGNRANYPKFYRMAQCKLAREQRKFSKCIRGSKNGEKQRKRVNKIHEKVANQRKDFLHKLSRKLADNFDIICIEDLDIKSMSNGLNLGKSIYDNSWGIFTSFLKYKLQDSGKYLIKIDRWFPSSKICSNCGNKKNSLKLSERIWTCAKCGTVHDRDYNAAINIMKEGIRTAGTSGIACDCLKY